MPRILEKSVEEKERDERFQISVDIAQQMVGTHHVSIDEAPHIISIHHGNLLVYSAFNAIHVKDPDQFDLAFDLAERYEQTFDMEYKIRKKY